MGPKENIPVLVTGGGGFVGSAIIKRLLKEGFVVSSLSRRDYPDLREMGVKCWKGDLSDSEIVCRAVEKQKIVIHTAAKATLWGLREEFLSSNVTGTQNILSACRANGVDKLIYTSSASVVISGKNIENGNETLPYTENKKSLYAHTKAQAERMVLEANNHSLKTVALRPHIVLGPGDKQILPKLINKAREGKLRIIGTGSNKIDIVYIENLVEAHLQAIKMIDKNPACHGRAFFITNGDPVNLWDFVNQLLVNMGENKIEKRIPANMAACLADLLYPYYLLAAGKEPLLTPILVKELSKSHWFDITAAQQELNYQPRFNSKETLEILSLAYRNE